MSSLPLRRLRPSPAVVAALVGALWAGTSGAVREFVWADLRDGVIRVGDLPRATRGLARVGFVLLFTMVGVLVVGDVLRGASDLLSTSSGTAARGAQVPVALLPLTLFMFSVAWAFLVAGAIRAQLAVTSGVCAVYLATAATWLGSTSHLAGRLEALASWALVVAVPVFVVVRRRCRERAVTEFLVLLLLVAASTGISLLLALRTMRTTGIALPVTSLGLLLSFLRGLVTPLLVLIGLDIADFALRVSRWSSQVAEERLPHWAVPALFLLVVGWRTLTVGQATFDDPGDGWGYVGALALPGVALVVAWAVHRAARRAAIPGTPAEDPADAVVEAAASKALPITVGYLGLQVALTIALLLLTAVVAVVTLPATTTGRIQELMTAIGELTTRGEVWRTIFWVAALAVAAVLARRGRAALAVYLGVLGGSGLLSTLAAPGRPLAAIGWSELQVEVAWLVVVLAVALRDAVTGRFTHRRAHALLIVAVALALLSASDFIGDPFSPVFAFAGVAFVAFGVVWDALTSGSWTNVGTDRLPRTSRIFLYLGYVLFSVTLIAWAVVSHDLDAVDHFTGGAAMDGFIVFGRPLIHAVVALLLFHPATDADADTASAGPSSE